MTEGVQGVSRSSIVEDHQCYLSCTCHRALKLNVYAAPSRVQRIAFVGLVFLEGSSLSNPIEARWTLTPKDCMQKEDVLALCPAQAVASQT